MDLMDTKMALSDADIERYCTKSNLDKAVHTLEGLLRGIAADKQISPAERTALVYWLEEHRCLADRHPFCEFVPALEMLINHTDTDEVIQDCIWLCDRLNRINFFYDIRTGDMQRFQGIICGILADEQILFEELKSFHAWMQDHMHLQGLWPFDSILTIVNRIVFNNHFNMEDQSALMALFQDFQRFINDRDGNVIAENLTIQSVCDSVSVIEFAGHGFCITGKSTKASRKQFETEIKNRGGFVVGQVSRSVDYLILGAGGNTCWAYSCYGRKVEEAIELRGKGKRISIINEYDFWAFCENNPVAGSTSKILLEHAPLTAPMAAGPLTGKTFVITGKLSAPREEIAARIEKMGGKVTGAVSANTSFLVCNEASGSGKFKKAQQLGVPVITEAQLEEMLR